MSKSKILSLILSIASGIVLLIQAMGVTTGDMVVDGIITTIMGLLVGFGIISDHKSKPNNNDDNATANKNYNDKNN